MSWLSRLLLSPIYSRSFLAWASISRRDPFVKQNCRIKVWIRINSLGFFEFQENDNHAISVNSATAREERSRNLSGEQLVHLEQESPEKHPPTPLLSKPDQRSSWNHLSKRKMSRVAVPKVKPKSSRRHIVYTDKSVKHVHHESGGGRPDRGRHRHAHQLHVRAYRAVGVGVGGVSVLAVGGLHGQHGVHLQPVHPERGPLLVHHVAAALPAKAHQETRTHHDRVGVGGVVHVDRADHQLAPRGALGRATQPGRRVRDRVRGQRRLQGHGRHLQLLLPHRAHGLPVRPHLLRDQEAQPLRNRSLHARAGGQWRRRRGGRLVGRGPAALDERAAVGAARRRAGAARVEAPRAGPPTAPVPQPDRAVVPRGGRGRPRRLRRDHERRPRPLRRHHCQRRVRRRRQRHRQNTLDPRRLEWRAAASVARDADAVLGRAGSEGREGRVGRDRAGQGEEGGAAAGRDNGRVRAVLAAVLRAVHGGRLLRGLRRPQVPHGHHLARLRQLDAQPRALPPVQRQLQARLQAHARLPPPPRTRASQEHPPATLPPHL
ncbi:uncharacterized protein LOC132193951 isoform X3 [Neocloeon triangulifer]|uniref:uncharacterized protein LOC132193951 isoform X3 n=1 Tax=Neocloeon triangulifer TaxID=2078957 RepID=UPI00286F6F2A|nr:uncharacterized protein LOC132193951 isoform X3 [Neocloeon triangulifer]